MPDSHHLDAAGYVDAGQTRRLETQNPAIPHLHVYLEPTPKVSRFFVRVSSRDPSGKVKHRKHPPKSA